MKFIESFMKLYSLNWLECRNNNFSDDYNKHIEDHCNENNIQLKM